MPSPRHDLIILGGGLAGGLAVLALRGARPDLNILLVEPGAIGGNHLWSFFDSDIASRDTALVDPLIVHRWPSYDVRFPGHRRNLSQAYRTIESERLDLAVRAALSSERILAARAVEATAASVTLESGETLQGGSVLDTRGLGAAPDGLMCGWQKFCGATLTVPAGHGLDRPIVMDATVDQAEGYRFVYCLPFSSTEVFVEDTYYSDTPELHPSKLTQRIAAYARQQGWAVAATARQESGVLPVVMGGDFDTFWPTSDGVARGGVRAALFHPLTSYSLPDAVRFATWLARDAPLDASLGAATRALARRHWQRGRFDRLLARMLLRAADPPERYRILERFYRLPEPLLGRFYAGQSTLADRVRILAGKPPVSVRRAVGTMMEKM
ncbi:MAG: lycopene beta-cyclase CrtY [Pseudomonadota bacterium]|nr:lycopene beta-cyclase CrtY [Pseudomonadota bacterium]